MNGGKLDPKFAKAQTVQGALIKYDKNNSLVGTMQVKVGKINARKNTVKFSAVATLILNGKAKKFTAKAVTVTVDASQRVPPTKIAFKVNDRIMSNRMTFEMGADGVFTLGSPSHGMAQATVGGALQGGARGTFRLEEFDLAVPGTLQDDLLPREEPFDVVGSRWKFAQPTTVKWMRDRETKEYGRVVDVIGFVVDGFGTGEASCRRPAGGPWAVTVE